MIENDIKNNNFNSFVNEFSCLKYIEKYMKFNKNLILNKDKIINITCDYFMPNEMNYNEIISIEIISIHL